MGGDAQSAEKEHTGLSPALFSSDRMDWATPQSFFDIVDAEFGFTLDAAAGSVNAKCATYYDEATDGLSKPWPGTVWCNPPYGRALKAPFPSALVVFRAGQHATALVTMARGELPGRAA